jgi:hypothetical protein
MSRFDPFAETLTPAQASPQKPRLVLMQPHSPMAATFLILVAGIALLGMVALKLVAPALTPSPPAIELAAMLAVAVGLILTDLRSPGVTVGGVALRAGLAGGAVGLTLAVGAVMVHWWQTGIHTSTYLALALGDASNSLAVNGALGAVFAAGAAPIAALFTCRWAVAERHHFLD